MKTLFKYFFIFISTLFVISCETGDDSIVKMGRISFSVGDQSNGRQNLSLETTSALLTISKSNGTVVHEMLKLDLFSFGSGFVTESIELPVGEYKLTAFFILDSNNTITYACPIEGSEQAQYVSDPLPIYFTVTENGTTSVVPQVLEVTPDTDPGSFGYVNFGFEIVTPSDSLEVNSIKLVLDNQLWQAAEVDSAVFNTDGNWLALMGRTYINDSTYEHVFIQINDYDFTTGEMPKEKLQIEMALNVSLSHGTGNFYNTFFKVPNTVQVTITEYNPVTRTISGTFSGHVYDQAGLNKKVITNGVFHKLKLMHGITNDGTVQDIDGNTYPTVKIGTQTWMAENLRTTKYSNGDLIGTTSPLTKNIYTESAPSYEWAYIGDESTIKYGHFYTWYTVIDNRNICPSGWHVPTADEWTTLIGNLGGFNVAGGKMKEANTISWLNPNTEASNSSGFTGLGTGYRHFYGSTSGIGYITFWWSSTEYDAENGWECHLSYESAAIYLNGNSPNKKMGLSVRCLKN